MGNALSRKQFLSGTLMAAGAAALGTAAMTARADEANGAFDLEYDVVVLGAGFAGCSAAIEASKVGDRL